MTLPHWTHWVLGIAQQRPEKQPLQLRATPSLFKNILLNIGGRGLLIMLTLLSTPVLVHRLGSEAYGVYILASTLGGLLAVLDFGLMPGVITFLSRAWHQHDDVSTQNIISTALTLYLGIGLICGGGLAMLVPWAVNSLLHVPPYLQAAASIALWLSTGSFVLNMWLSIFNAIPIALERYDLITMRMIVLSLATTIAMIVFALLGGGIESLMLINVLGTITGLGLFFLVGRALLPNTRFVPGFDRTIFHELARFSAYKFVGTLGGILAFRFDQFAISAMLGINAVGLYAIPANSTSRVFALLTELASPLFPRASKFQQDGSALRELLLRGTRFMALIAGIVLSLLFVFADLVLEYWIGGDQGRMIADQSTAAMRWLLVAFYIQAIATILTLFCEGLGHPEINNGFAAVAALLHVPLVLVLVPRLGITGAALALFLSSIALTVPFIVFSSYRLAQINVWDLFNDAISRPLITAGSTVGIGFIVHILIHGLVSFMLAVVFMAFVFVTIAWVTKALTRKDVSSLGRVAVRLPGWVPARNRIIAILIKV